MSESPPDRLSVLHLLAPAAVGGIETVVRLLAAGQRRRGHDVLVAPIVADIEARIEWIDSVRAAGVAVEPLIVRRRRYVAEWRAASEVLASRRPSVVHTHGYHADVIGALAARGTGLATAATVHGFIGGDWKNRAYEWLQGRVLSRFDAVIAVSRPMADRLRRAGVSADRLHVVANAFDDDGGAPLPREAARRALGLMAEGFHVGWVGRLSPEKGADVMLRALAHLPAADTRLSVIGDGGERRHLEGLARELRVADRVTWHGTRADAARLLAAFDVVALSSRTEGTPIVLFEAIAAGTPVVATRVGGVPDVVSEAEAILVAPEDPPALARGLEAVRANAEAAATRTAAARRRLSREHSVGPWLARVDAVYAAAIRRRESARTR